MKREKEERDIKIQHTCGRTRPKDERTETNKHNCCLTPDFQGEIPLESTSPKTKTSESTQLFQKYIQQIAPKKQPWHQKRTIKSKTPHHRALVHVHSPPLKPHMRIHTRPRLLTTPPTHPSESQKTALVRIVFFWFVPSPATRTRNQENLSTTLTATTSSMDLFLNVFVTTHHRHL